MYRKRSGLSQDETALLLGYPTGQQVCRYERLARQPPLHIVLAYEALFGVPVRELLGGVFEKQQEAIRKRAGIVIKQLEQQKPNRRTTRKLQLLQTITS